MPFFYTGVPFVRCTFSLTGGTAEYITLTLLILRKKKLEVTKFRKEIKEPPRKIVEWE